MISALGGELQGVLETLKEIEAAEVQKIVAVMDFIGIRTIEHLRSFTTETAPPIRPGDPPRRRHPGYWADRTGQLAAGYRYTVTRSGRGAVLTLENPVEHGVTLEAREGYFVLSGVADKGGPVEAALRAAIAALAPGWDLVVYE